MPDSEKWFNICERAHPAASPACCARLAVEIISISAPNTAVNVVKKRHESMLHLIYVLYYFLSGSSVDNNYRRVGAMPLRKV